MNAVRGAPLRLSGFPLAWRVNETVNELRERAEDLPLLLGLRRIGMTCFIDPDGPLAQRYKFIYTAHPPEDQSATLFERYERVHTRYRDVRIRQDNLTCLDAGRLGGWTAPAGNRRTDDDTLQRHRYDDLLQPLVRSIRDVHAPVPARASLGGALGDGALLALGARGAAVVAVARMGAVGRYPHQWPLLLSRLAVLSPAGAFGIDFHHRLSVTEAAWFCQMIPRGSLAFLEEPIRCESPDAYAAEPRHEEAVKEHPFVPYEHPHLRRPDGSYTNW